MKPQTKKPFLPTKRELKGCLWLLLAIPLLAIVAVIGKIIAQFLVGTLPTPELIIALIFITVLIGGLWFYRKRKKDRGTK